MSAYAGVAAERWRARPGLARACRVTAFAGPVVAVTALAFLATRWLPAVSGTVATIGRWAFIAIVALICAVLAERLLSRLLPIAALLDLDIGFPSGAPTRLRIASLASLRTRDADLRDRLPGSADHDIYAAAEYALIGYATRVRPGLQPRPHLERVRMLSMLVAARLGLSAQECDRLQWALLLRELGSHRLDERAVGHPLVEWLGTWAALLHEPFVTVAQHAPSKTIGMAAHAAAVSDAYAVVTASHPYRRGVGSGHAGRRLKHLGDPRLLPEAVDALLTLPEARLRKAIGFTAGLPPVIERFAPAPQPVMAATAIVVVLALAASPMMRRDPSVEDGGAQLAGLDTQAETAPEAPPSDAAQAPVPERAADSAGDEDDNQTLKRESRDRGGSASIAGARFDYASAGDGNPSSGGSGSADSGGSTSNTDSKPDKGTSGEPSSGTGDGGSDPGDGGSDPGDGGSDPGDGGSDPGDGGSDPGDGGSDPGDGGSDPGDGGSEPGDGGEDPPPTDEPTEDSDTGLLPGLIGVLLP